MLPRIAKQVIRINRSTLISSSSRISIPLLNQSRFQINSNSSNLCNCFSTSTSSKLSNDTTAKASYSIGELSTKEYQTASDRAMDRLTEYMEELMEEVAGQPGSENMDIEYSSGVLTMKITDAVTYVINKQPPNKQIWLASPISGPKRYDYDTKHKVWFYHRDNSLMRDLLNSELKVLMNNESVDVDLGEEDHE